MANAPVASEARMSDVEEGLEKLLPLHRYQQDKFPPNLWIIMACKNGPNEKRRLEGAVSSLCGYFSLGSDKSLLLGRKEGRKLADDLADPLGKRFG